MSLDKGGLKKYNQWIHTAAGRRPSTFSRDHRVINIVQIKTNRLLLIPYEEAQLEIAVKDQVAAAQTIGAFHAPPTFSQRRFMGKIYAAKLLLVRAEPRAWLLSTYWQIVQDYGMPVVIGTVGFKGPPKEGVVEIGYGLQEQYRGKGYMTEAVAAMCDFAFSQTEFPVERIFAATERSNAASQRVLSRNGFEMYDVRRGLCVWNLRAPSNAILRDHI